MSLSARLGKASNMNCLRALLTMCKRNNWQLRFQSSGRRWSDVPMVSDDNLADCLADEGSRKWAYVYPHRQPAARSRLMIMVPLSSDDEQISYDTDHRHTMFNMLFGRAATAEELKPLGDYGEVVADRMIGEFMQQRYNIAHAINVADANGDAWECGVTNEGHEWLRVTQRESELGEFEIG